MSSTEPKMTPLLEWINELYEKSCETPYDRDITGMIELPETKGKRKRLLSTLKVYAVGDSDWQELRMDLEAKKLRLQKLDAEKQRLIDDMDLTVEKIKDKVLDPIDECLNNE